MATALTLKQAIAAVWQKFVGVIGYADISGIGDGTVKGAIAGLNGNTVFYANAFSAQQGVTINSDYTYAIKQGKIVHLVIRFTTGQYKDVSLRMIQLPEALKPARASHPFAGETWQTGVGQVQLNAEGCHIRPTTGTKVSTDYTLDCVYIAADY